MTSMLAGAERDTTIPSRPSCFHRATRRRLASMKGTLAVTGDPEADELLNTDPLALLVGMLLDQQVR